MHADELRKRVSNGCTVPKAAWQSICWPGP